MEKKKMKRIALSLGLVGALGVGGTLALFTDFTDVLTNTFSMFGTPGEEPIDVTIKEYAVDEDQFDDYLYHDETEDKPATGWTTEGVTYEDLKPGQKVDKNPTVTVGADSVDCVVVARVDNLNQTGWTVQGLNESEWKTVKTNGDSTYYQYVGSKSSEGVIKNSDGPTILTPIFTGLTINSDLTTVLSFDQIKVSAAAVQYDEVDDPVTEAIKIIDTEWN